MIFRNGIRMTLRARGRTALFLLAYPFVLTLSLTLGLGAVCLFVFRIVCHG